MRKRLVSVRMIPLLLLVGCGVRKDKPEDVFTSFREELAAAASVSATVQLTADFGGTVSDYTLEVASDGERTTVSITEPALIAGITASVRDDGTEIAYDGVMLGVGDVDPEGTTPVSALPAILRAMRAGYAELYWIDGTFAAARYSTGQGGSACTVWLDPDARSPVAAEIASEGKTVINCRFTDWRME